jgi:hypothetical protein
MDRPMHRPERGLARDPPMKALVGARRGQGWRAANGSITIDRAMDAGKNDFSRRRR